MLPAGAVFKIDRVAEGGEAVKAKTGWLVRTGAGLLALDATSTDDGCTVGFDPTAHQFQSPCHGSIYALDGAVLRGPASAPLIHLAFRELDANRFAVERSLA